MIGALSPQTRNAQVSMFEDETVDYIVATDAIGMGLNLNVNNVSMSSLKKYDGKKLRYLKDTELAQIVGRAGRNQIDGSFGSTLNCPQINDNTINICKRTVLGKLLRSDFESSNIILALSIIQSLNLSNII